MLFREWSLRNSRNTGANRFREFRRLHSRNNPKNTSSDPINLRCFLYSAPLLFYSSAPLLFCSSHPLIFLSSQSLNLSSIILASSSRVNSSSVFFYIFSVCRNVVTISTTAIRGHILKRNTGNQTR